MIIPVKSKSDISAVVKANQTAWYVIVCNEIYAKCYGNWCQRVQYPDGTKASGVSGHATQKAFVAELAQLLKLE